MFDKTGEYVAFNGNFTCVGAVESYLTDLERKMQLTLQEILIQAEETAQ